VLPPCLLVAFSFQPAIADDLGWCKMSNRDQAIVACSRLPALNPKFADAYFNHRGIYCGMGDIANADQAIWLGAKDASPCVNRSASYEGKGDHDRAIVDFDQVLKLRPWFGEALQGGKRVQALPARGLHPLSHPAQGHFIGKLNVFPGFNVTNLCPTA
jgi:tetratricopeptide (TPR) repeat protein